MSSNVLFLYTQADKSRCEELRDYLQGKLASLVDIITVDDALAEDSTLEDELFQSRCVLLVYTQDSEKHLQEGTFDFDLDYVLFDGSITKAFLEQDEVVGKVIGIHFGWRPDQWLYDRLPKRIFHVSETLDFKDNPKVAQIVDTIKGIVKKKK
ncbi:hypothetical protein OS493_035002 [Desmophyllum pertusum]|uniref:Uncharacterized protein n=1 Tax=Desmophyllum pertusum TaxID=174260 RepID=A0A9X0CCU0_9CNID|nr:hypothetical protein OS493_035002 [Desmophyllum pertusum]